MTLHLRKPPRDDRARVSEILDALPAPDWKVRSSAAGAPLLYSPMPVYCATNEALARSEVSLASTAELAGWRYLIDEEGELTLIDLFGDDGEGYAVRRGGGASQVSLAGLFAEKMSADLGDLEVRYLQAMEIGFEALWLHAEVGPSFVVDASGSAFQLVSLERWLVAVSAAAADRVSRLRSGIQLDY